MFGMVPQRAPEVPGVGPAAAQHLCGVCGAAFVRPRWLAVHMRMHSNVRAYHCHMCHAAFTTSGSLMKHARTHGGVPGWPPSAGGGGPGLVPFSAPVGALYMPPPPPPPQPPQRQCSAPRPPGAARPHACDVCPAAFRSAHDLSRHALSHTGERPHVCGVCYADFILPGHLVRHMITHTGERPYACAVCHAAFASSTHLTSHLRTHTGERPYKCDVCDAAFAEAGNRTRHMRTHAPALAPPPRETARV
jgi:KRAB domain-containing zinc finger protein